MILRELKIPISIDGIEDTIKLLKEANDLSEQLNETLDKIAERGVIIRIGTRTNGDALAKEVSEYLQRGREL